jgi:hypothetical protein
MQRKDLTLDGVEEKYSTVIRKAQIEITSPSRSRGLGFDPLLVNHIVEQLTLNQRGARSMRIELTLCRVTGSRLQT